MKCRGLMLRFRLSWRVLAVFQFIGDLADLGEIPEAGKEHQVVLAQHAETDPLAILEIHGQLLVRVIAELRGQRRPVLVPDRRFQGFLG